MTSFEARCQREDEEDRLGLLAPPLTVTVVGGEQFKLGTREEELGVWLECCKARGRHRLQCPEYHPIGFIDERMPG
jgi:hypothetical protein